MNLYGKGSPYTIDVTAGEAVYICQCGHTNNPPYCDGTHSKYPGTEPLAHTPKSDGEVHVCGCGKTSTKPWCDGTHLK